MTISTPSTLRLRLLVVQPRLTLTEIQLVDDVVFYQRIDGRDGVPTEVRAVRPSAADGADLRHVLERAAFWSWPCRWSLCEHRYTGDFAIGIEWNGRAARSAGSLCIAREVDAVLDAIQRLVGKAPPRASKAVATLLRADPPRPPTHRTFPAAHGAAVRWPPYPDWRNRCRGARARTHWLRKSTGSLPVGDQAQVERWAASTAV